MWWLEQVVQRTPMAPAGMAGNAGLSLQTGLEAAALKIKKELPALMYKHFQIVLYLKVLR